MRGVAIVPALNEEDTIASVIAELREYDPRSRSSSSTTARTTAPRRRARAAGARVLRLPFNLGIGGAVQTGFRYAYENDFDYAVRVDGDGQHDPAQLGAVVGPVVRGETNIAVGSRWLARAEAATARRLRGAWGSASSRAWSRC